MQCAVVLCEQYCTFVLTAHFVLAVLRGRDVVRLWHYRNWRGSVHPFMEAVLLFTGTVVLFMGGWDPFISAVLAFMEP